MALPERAARHALVGFLVGAHARPRAVAHDARRLPGKAAHSAPRVLDMAVKNAPVVQRDRPRVRGWRARARMVRRPRRVRSARAASYCGRCRAGSCAGSECDDEQRAGQRRRFGLPERIAHVPVSVLRKRRTPMPAPSQAGLRRPTEAHRKVPLKNIFF